MVRGTVRFRIGALDVLRRATHAVVARARMCPGAVGAGDARFERHAVTPAVLNGFGGAGVLQRVVEMGDAFPGATAGVADAREPRVARVRPGAAGRPRVVFRS